jgi:UDP-N-acetyl-D-mannosaminuronic acid transferase (WecB/TagA/CpsF family)
LKLDFWVYRLVDQTWHLLQTPPLRARAAQVMAYHDKHIYMFGGKEGDNSPVEQRLGDFWQVEMIAMKDDEALRRAKFLVRKHRYEICFHLI